MSLRDRFFQSQARWSDPFNGGPPDYLENAYNAGYVQNVNTASSQLPPRRRQSMDAAVKYHMKQKQELQKLQHERDNLARQLHGLHRARQEDTVRFKTHLTQFSKQLNELRDEYRKSATSRSSGRSGTPPVERKQEPARSSDAGSGAGREELPSEVLPTAGVSDSDRHADKHDE